MATTSSPGVPFFRTCFAFLGFFMLATLIYTCLTDGSPFRMELLTPWMIATLVDFYINVIAISVWVIYGEPSIISTIIWIAFLICFGSITTCAYVFLQLSRISFQVSGGESSYPILHYAERQERVVKQRLSSLLFWRIIFSLLGCIMLGTLVYTLLTDGSPFRKELLTPWMTATLIDFYINVAAISFWVAQKERNWICTIFWIILLVCLGSIATCAYIVKQLLNVSAEDVGQVLSFMPRRKESNRQHVRVAPSL